MAVDSATNINIGKTRLAIQIQTSVAAWVRIYATAAARTADLSRPITSDPAVNAGVLLEVLTTSAILTLMLTPGIILHSEETTPIVGLPMTVVNYSGGTAAITVTAKTLPLE